MTDKRKNIISSAVNLFVEKGFQGTPTSAIAREANVSNGTLFHYFDSKEALIQSIYRELQSSYFEFCLKGIESAEEVKERIHRIWERSVHWAMNNENGYFFMKQVVYSPYYPLSEGEKENSLRKELVAIAEKGIEKREIMYIPEDLIYELFESYQSGLVNYLRYYPIKYRTPEFMRKAFEWYWQSIRA